MKIALVKSTARHAFAAVVGLSTALLSAHALAAYNFTTIAYPGATSTSTFGLNNVGQVVGSATFDLTTGAGAGFVYNVATASFTTVPLTSTGHKMTPLGINDAGILCGSSFDPVSLINTGQIFSAGSYTAFSYPGRTNTLCRAINNAGTVTGYAENGGGDAVGFIYSPTAIVPIEFPGSIFMIAQGINAAGTVVGSVIQPAGAVFPSSPAGNYGWVRNAAGVVTTFRINGIQTRARGINDHNQVAGWVTIPAVGQRGFVIDMPSGGGHVDVTVPVADLILVPGSVNTFVEGINNLGHLVGIHDTGTGTEFAGFVATIPVGELIDDLTELITGMGLPRGTERSLLAKVEAADAAFTRGNVSAACSQLQALINHARAQSGRHLTVAQANAIIDAANAVRQAMGCA